MARGFSLIETVVAAAVIALLLGGAALTLGTRPFAASTATIALNAQVQAARALAASTGNGATIIVQPDGAGGFKSVLYGGRPNVPPLTVSTIAAVISQAQISEATVGAPPFAIFMSSDGGVRMEANYPPRSEFDSVNVPHIASEPACPASGRYTISLRGVGSPGRIDLVCPAPAFGTPLPVVTNSPPP